MIMFFGESSEIALTIWCQMAVNCQWGADGLLELRPFRFF